MKALIDADMLVYEVAFGVEFKNDEGVKVIRDFDAAIRLLEHKLQVIQEETWCEGHPTLYLTGGSDLEWVVGDAPIEHNFREDVAVTKPYKGGRSQDKPFHYANLRWYIYDTYNCKLSWAYEADDLICIDHLKDPDNTIICTRDKDLRQCPGNHYGWMVGKQLGFGPKLIDKHGYLEKTSKGVKGGGDMFFYAQMIIGDTVDNIPGLKGCGDAAAYKLLVDCKDEGELHEAVAGLYEKKVGEHWREYFKEQAALLWMCRGFDDQGKLIHFVMYDERGGDA